MFEMRKIQKKSNVGLTAQEWEYNKLEMNELLYGRTVEPIIIENI